MRKFFILPEDIRDNKIYITKSEDLHHLRKVLRMKIGDELDVSDGEKWEYRCDITNINEDEVELLIVDKQGFSVEPEVKVALFQGIPKSSKMETIIQKNVEIGVSKICPIFMKRTIVVDRGNFGKKLARWQKIADEAVKQCKRGIIPQIEQPIKFNQVFDKLKDFDLILMPYENEENISIKDVLKDYVSAGRDIKSIAVIIGPEGGFADEEATSLQDAGAYSASLGKTILRTETAGMVALAMIMYELEL